MKIEQKIVKTLAERPFMALEYGWKCVIFTFNYLIWKFIPRRGIIIGVNPHIMNILCFQAERPGSCITVGDGFTAYSKCQISAWGQGQVRIGDNCSFGSRTRINCREKVEIGNYVLISWDVTMADFDGHPVDPDIRAAEMEHSKRMLWPQFVRKPRKQIEPYTPKFKSKPIIIEDKVWIGARVIILKGVRIGYNSIVAAGTVVARDVPPCSIVAGNPALIVKKLNKNDTDTAG